MDGESFDAQGRRVRGVGGVGGGRRRSEGVGGEFRMSDGGQGFGGCQDRHLSARDGRRRLSGDLPG